MIAVRAVKSFFPIIAGGTVAAGVLALVGAALLVLFVIPGGLGIYENLSIPTTTV
jgi:hypothetical protein